MWNSVYSLKSNRWWRIYLQIFFFLQNNFFFTKFWFYIERRIIQRHGSKTYQRTSINCEDGSCYPFTRPWTKINANSRNICNLSKTLKRYRCLDCIPKFYNFFLLIWKWFSFFFFFVYCRVCDYFRHQRCQTCHPSRKLTKKTKGSFIENGATVFISGRDEKTLKEATAELNSKGPGKCFAIACNVAKPEEIKVNKDKKLF